MKDKYTVDVELNVKDSLKELKRLRQEVKDTANEIDFSIKKLSIKRKDILVVKLNGMFKQDTKMKIEKQLKKKLHRKVLVIDNLMELHLIEK